MTGAPVRVPLGHRAYDIHIGTGLLGSLGELCVPVCRGRACLVVTDSNVGPLYADACLASLRASGYEPVLAEIPAGEASKSTAQLDRLWGAASDAGLDRRAMIVALGGGVVGDLAGFLAASYLRGVTLVQIPTSLLAMVDSSVGGKTGINLPQGKNLVGAFHQPALVLADLSLLATLPPREFSAGMAEVVKYGVIRDEPFFRWLEESFSCVQRREVAALERIVRCSCEIKAEVVGRDERELGERAILNLGHTFGHAIEAATGYVEWLHGEAVATGMLIAADMSLRLGRLTDADVERVRRLLARAGLPVQAPRIGVDGARGYMQIDKKVRAGRVRLVLLQRIGAAEFTGDYPDAALSATLEAHFA